MSAGRITGIVKAYDAVAGQGVIVRDDGQGEVFVDVFGLQLGDEMKMREGVRVEFQALAHTTGPRAEGVVVLDAQG
jgi:cold shock CspA family protein